VSSDVVRNPVQSASGGFIIIKRGFRHEHEQSSVVDDRPNVVFHVESEDTSDSGAGGDVVSALACSMAHSMLRVRPCKVR